MKHALILLILSWMAGITLAQEQCFPEKDDKRLVYDISGVIDASRESRLESTLQDFARSTSNQIVVVIVDELCGYDKAVYATELGETWGVGQKEEDNGIVLLIKPKTTQARGEFFIAVGRGLEGVIPDGTTYLIQENELLPYLRQGDYATALDSTTHVLMQLAKQEFSSNEYSNRMAKPKGKRHGWMPFVFFILVLVIFLTIKSRSVSRYARRNNITWWAAWWLLNQSRSKHRGYWGDFSGGRGGFGGFGGGGGGGFGGFGGGSFGGGGSGGSW